MIILGTLQHLSDWGYRTFAVDFPSNRNNSLPMKGDQEAVQWLTQLIQTLHLSNVVIISPPISGPLSLPYIFQLNEQQKLIQGFVVSAPVEANKFRADDYKKIKVSQVKLLI
jgi:hypothetical protein